MDVIFRYVNGRIVPIRIDKSQTTSEYMNKKIRGKDTFYNSLTEEEKENYDYLTKEMVPKMPKKEAKERILEKRRNAEANTTMKSFKGEREYEKAINNGYNDYGKADIGRGGKNYEQIAKDLEKQGYQVRIFEETTSVRGMHNYHVLYKKKDKE